MAEADDRVSFPDEGRRLRWLRRARGLKQSAIAELANVTQPTVSRWERGELAPSPDIAQRLFDALTRATNDRASHRLVESSTLPMHLVTDLDHRLLAASAPREREWRRSADDLRSQSLWRYAIEDIQIAEATLDRLGWWRRVDPEPIGLTLSGGNAGLEIKAGTMIWERLHLADGTPVRLCTSPG
jgi:transcriptional regulator with XRE-family HTH domain